MNGGARSGRAPLRPRGGPFWPRIAAGMLDWLLASSVAWLGAVAGLGLARAVGLGEASAGTWAVIAVLAGVGAAAYFAALLPRGRTLGMRANGLRVVAAATGRAPRPRRALARAVASAASGVAWFGLLAFALSDPEGGYSTMEVVAAIVAALVAGAAFAGLVWQVADRAQRSAQDRLFGVAVVDERDVDWAA